MKSEKVSVNINDDKLSAIDLLVDEGLVENRSAFINEAIDLLLQMKQPTVQSILTKRQQTLSPNQWFIGLQSMDGDYLTPFKEQEDKLTLKGFGSLYLDKDVEPTLLKETVAFISKRIRVHGTKEQLEALEGIWESKK